ncbi:N-carbamoyl-D-amino-acid hydrolase [Tengunoibacter tsumagoiensis]|uniref:N-carbamoyl-D-amino-acid hydrolase n=1 Tax=Tengunoibacter tsumagoiensis TaxID=2014871 RepID=A0A402A9U7_9CHLR|nr:N-carbamoyl-D-amino-acid hydrolase [Tengunoibacter tsumagoiensis]
MCELPDEREAFPSAWKDLITHIKEQKSELVLLPELPFSAWFPRTPQFDAEIWRKVQQEHERMMTQLSDLAPAIVLGTTLITENGHHFNRGFIWSSQTGFQGVHDKYYFPNEEDFYEQIWFDRNEEDFSLAHVQDVAAGFLICTEVMFTERARSYGKQGANIVAVPRASCLNFERWLVAIRMAAISSGAFALSSNRVSSDLFIGRGVVVSPDGDVLASTSRQNPFVTAEIDLTESTRAKKTYPRDVLE